jgi:DNA-binding transcriptional regulator YdaS (Cro superfamily)
MDPAAAFERAIRIAGSQCKLAAAIGCSQAAIAKARRRGAVSPAMALAVHRFTAGVVPACALRPDLWARAEDVPAAAPRIAPRTRGAGARGAGARGAGARGARGRAP